MLAKLALPAAGLLILALSGGRDARADTILVGGAVMTPMSVNDASLTGTTVMANSSAYVGSSVYGLIMGAGFLSPTQVNGNPNGNLLDYVVVTSTSGQSVVLSEGEIDPGFGGHTTATTDIIATAMNGTPIAPQLIVPGDVNGGMGGRDIASIASISVVEAGPNLAAIAGQPTTQFSISGNLASPGMYTSLAPSVTENVSYRSGSGTTNATFTGSAIYTLLANSGLTTDPAAILDDYLVATGSDGYGVVYSLGELDPTYHTDPTGPALVASTSGTFRSTSPGDYKGGRYVSGLENLNVATAVPEPATLALFGVPVLLLVLRRRRPG